MRAPQPFTRHHLALGRTQIGTVRLSLRPRTNTDMSWSSHLILAGPTSRQTCKKLLLRQPSMRPNNSSKPTPLRGAA